MEKKVELPKDVNDMMYSLLTYSPEVRVEALKAMYRTLTPEQQADLAQDLFKDAAQKKYLMDDAKKTKEALDKSSLKGQIREIVVTADTRFNVQNPQKHPRMTAEEIDTVVRTIQGEEATKILADLKRSLDWQGKSSEGVADDLKKHILHRSAELIAELDHNKNMEKEADESSPSIEID